VTPAPAPKPAAVVTPAPVVSPRPAGGGLIIPSSNSVLKIVASSESGEGGSFADLFPTLVIKGGNAGGTISPSNGTPKEIGDQLPQGKQPINGVFLAFRVEAQSWPSDFDSKQEGDRPIINAAISCNDAESTQLLLKGCENFQFCPEKEKWDGINSGPGRLRPVFQLLVYLPQFDDVVVLQVPPLLKSWQTMSSILAGMAGPNGELANFPASFAVTTKTWYDKNVFHYFDIVPQVNDAGRVALEKYAAFVGSVQQTRPDLAEAIMDWFNCTDKPLTDEQRAKLEQASNMVNPRRRRG
jgi:hypothetical protein